MSLKPDAIEMHQPTTKSSQSSPGLALYKTSYHPPPRPRYANRKPIITERGFAWSVTLTLILMCSIGIPLGAILPPRLVTPLPLNVLLPLYTAPEILSWQTLFDALIAHHTLNFTVIVSPRSGPGTPPFPGAPYISTITRLNGNDRVRTLGYIDVAHGNRTNTSVFADIDTYAGWSKQDRFGVHGIFFDRTPAGDDDDGDAEQIAYLRNITRYARNATGLLEPKVVAFNVGSVPSRNVSSIGADLTVVYEGAYGGVPGHGEVQGQLRNRTGKRENWGYLVHSVPKDVKRTDLRMLINDARKSVGYLFATDLSEEFYEGWGLRWNDFLELLPS
ncbi:hypothetical protein EJ04DRAFT_583270 [Polyplosphaeria fusca]|uniref:Spherulation-specific family 4 n=1 Tax=Polyplosphaeria fusca TaxID=682080 RepID=A0A9P4V7Y6_9PLEO|nr:hypothetical protein EJ04DRAFT_583270 [Polyplosphaeria fusca]